MQKKDDKNTFQRIYDIINRIPAGQVATYGQIALLAGIPRNARVVGYALHGLSDMTVPWHRVVAKNGVLNMRCCQDGELNIQRILLEGEGISFTSDGRVDLEKHSFKSVDNFAEI